LFGVRCYFHLHTHTLLPPLHHSVFLVRCSVLLPPPHPHIQHPASIPLSPPITNHQSLITLRQLHLTLPRRSNATASLHPYFFFVFFVLLSLRALRVKFPPPEQCDDFYTLMKKFLEKNLRS
jgi:hypothetical protein